MRRTLPTKRNIELLLPCTNIYKIQNVLCYTMIVERIVYILEGPVVVTFMGAFSHLLNCTSFEGYELSIIYNNLLYIVRRWRVEILVVRIGTITNDVLL